MSTYGVAPVGSSVDGSGGTGLAAGAPPGAGTAGVEMTWQEEQDVFHRDAFMAGTGTPTFRLHFTAQKEISDDPMVGQMISSFHAK